MKNLNLFLLWITRSTALLMLGLVGFGFLIITVNTGLPDAQNIKNVELKIPLRVYSAEGLLISEFGNERRKPVNIENIPRILVDALLASEDDNFFHHNGIDIGGLIRAALSNFRSGATQQGASTITMQVARNFFLSREKTYLRKLREVLLAIKLEQILTKNEILSLYLNKIFLGHRAYGFGAAADVYYDRELDELTLAEIAMLAGLPKAPSSNNPLRNPERAQTRRNYVLSRLQVLGKINGKDYLTASTAPITAEKHHKNIQLRAPHIAEMVRAQLTVEFGEQAYWQGLNVYTTIMATPQKAAEQTLRSGLQAYDRRHGFRGPITTFDSSQLVPEETQAGDQENQGLEQHYSKLLSVFPNSQDQVPALIIETDQQTATAHTLDFGSINLNLTESKWARRYLTANSQGERPKSMNELLRFGDVVYIRPIRNPQKEARQDKTDALERRWQLSQIPNVSGALVSIEPSSGRILSLVGGYDFFLNKFNRAIQSIRQPGSNIKPFIYSASLDKGFTPATLISGAPIVITDATHGTVWRPENYSGKFFGPTRIREALTKSLNLVSIRLLRAIGIPYAREYLERFGIDMRRFSPTLTMALGAGGITPLEMLSAYGTLANSGYRIEPYFIDYIRDRNGEIIYRAKHPVPCDVCYLDYLPQEEVPEQNELAEIPVLEPDTDTTEAVEPGNNKPEALKPVTETYDAPRVMSAVNNFLTVSMLKDVVRHGTARKALVLNRQDLAGKTGTTNNYVDAWFTGFNTKVATTVWVGFDEPGTMGKGEAGSVAALPIWVDYMRIALADVKEDLEQIPEFIEQGWVNRVTGERCDELDPEAVVEYFPIIELLPVYGVENPGFDSDIIDQSNLLDAPDQGLLDEEFIIDDQPVEPRIIETKEDTEGLF